MADFEDVVAEGTVDEKRRFIRAFVRRIEIEPAVGRTVPCLVLSRTCIPLEALL